MTVAICIIDQHTEVVAVDWVLAIVTSAHVFRLGRLGPVIANFLAFQAWLCVWHPATTLSPCSSQHSLRLEFRMMQSCPLCLCERTIVDRVVW